MLKIHFGFVIFFLMIYRSGVVAQSTPELILPEGLNGIIKLNISTLPNQRKDVLDYDHLAVFVKNEEGNHASNPVQGLYTREGDYLVFKPYFPFESGMTYVVRTKNANSEDDGFYQTFRIGMRKKVEQPKVVNIYPLASQLPENLLRFYIYFNTPMKKGQALKHIQLIDTAGNIDKHAFMEFKQELWSGDSKRLTVLFDPGRIKRGVSTNVLRGPALVKGKRYTLSLSGDWRDVYNQPLSANTTKEIEVVSAYRQSIKVNEWVIDQPKANSYDTLTIHFDRIMDHALIQSMIQLVDAEKNFIAGHWEVVEQEQQIQFIPEKKWHKGKYQIAIDSRLEDVAGNNLYNLLDHHTTGKEYNIEPNQFIDFEI